jgi:hypothetical protein
VSVRPRRLSLELLRGREVHDSLGERAGRIECVLAERTGTECVVRAVLLGPAAWFHRFGISAASLLGWSLESTPLQVPWELLDLSDETKPRLRVSLAELHARER